MAITTKQMTAISSTGTYAKKTPTAVTDAQRAIFAVSHGMLITAAPAFRLSGFSRYGHGFQMN